MSVGGGTHDRDYYDKVMIAVHAATNEKLNRVGDLVRDLAKQDCPVRTGALQKSIRVRRYPAERMVRIIAGNKKAWYPHIVILGTVERWTGRKKKIGKVMKLYGKNRNTGVMPPNNFFQIAFDAALPHIRYEFGKPMGTTITLEQ